VADKFKRNIDNFERKLIQKSVVENLKKYILWQREIRNGKDIDANSIKNRINFGPFSINLDITVACNYRCIHCVDSKVLNSGKSFNFADIKRILMVLVENGLKSVLLIGGGEPTLYTRFEDVVKLIKDFGLEIGIVTNGSRMKKILNVANYLGERDWVRLSLDSATNETFRLLHKPVTAIALKNICSSVKDFKAINNKTPVGFSYIIFWEGCRINGKEIRSNLKEMPEAVELAIENNFDYISFKPCLIKDEITENRETLLYKESTGRQKGIINQISRYLKEAKAIANEDIKIVESINLRALFDNKYDEFKKQSLNCHCQIFRQIVTPIGIYHCPAYRGDPKSYIAPKDGFISQQKYEETVRKNIELLFNFDARKECKDIVCFYNRLNWWIEDFINSNREVDSIHPVPDENFFL
jgi:MoaA/NifB/PqqE/SkfB family radical SAM enzyme